MSRAAQLIVLAISAALAACESPAPRSPEPRPAEPRRAEPVPGSARTPDGSGTAQPVPQRPAPPPARTHQLGSAASVLVAQARTQSAAGQHEMAAGLIERALRIEPSNPLLWIELGKVRQTDGRHDQAQAMGEKALGLAGGDPAVRSSAWRLIAQALRSRGRLLQAREAEARAAEAAPR